jgi:sigma-B regulation protein RsbU (phosphoserine phosphatase)
VRTDTKQEIVEDISSFTFNIPLAESLFQSIEKRILIFYIFFCIIRKMQEIDEISRLQKENQRLRRALEELAILNEIAVAINSALSLDRILESIIQKCTKHLAVEQAAVLLLDEKIEEKPFQTMVRGWDTEADSLPYRLDTQLTGWMLKNKAPLLINDLEKDSRFQLFSQDSRLIHSLLSVPLFSKNRMIGLVTVFNKKAESGFNIDDQRLLSIIGSQSAQVIENARLLEEEQKLLKVQQELRLAYDIQTNLLPKESPKIEGYDISGKSIPAKDVGGDYFDFIPIDSHRLVFCLGDISGKGMPAALLMSNLQATVRGQSLVNVTAAECVECCNTMLFHNTPPEKFSTFFFGILETKTHKMTYANAGHNFPFLFSAGGERQLEESDIVLGIMETFPFCDHKVSFEPGDIFVLFSDGITEAINNEEEEFGESRLVTLIAENKETSAEELTVKIIDAVKRHAGDCIQFDDMTVLIIKKE